MLISARDGNAHRRFPPGLSGIDARTQQHVTRPVLHGITWGSEYLAFPVGALEGALVLPIEYGGIGADLSGYDTTTGDINGLGNQEASLSGAASVSVASYGLTMLLQMVAETTGAASVTAGVNGRAQMAATIDVSTLTQNDVEGAILDARIDGTYTLRDVLKMLAAVSAGKTTITDLGGGAATVVFRDLADTADVVTASMSGSERSSVTLNP